MTREFVRPVTIVASSYIYLCDVFPFNSNVNAGYRAYQLPSARTKGSMACVKMVEDPLSVDYVSLVG